MDRAGKGDTAEICAADQAANQAGRDAGKGGVSCSAACGCNFLFKGGTN